jgi:small subunit ribosomal protein S3
MGQKIHPTGFRLAVTRDWSSRWYANSKNFSGMLIEDLQVRDYLKKKLKHASVGRVLIERPAKNARVTIFSARPGVVIGKKGEEIDTLRAALQKIMGVPVHVSIEEIRKPELDSQLIADSIAQQLEKRIMFRRAMKRAMQNAMRLGAQGIKIMSSGRLNGAEIARREWYREGRVPLHTLRADIDYASLKQQRRMASSVSRCGCSRVKSPTVTNRRWSLRKPQLMIRPASRVVPPSPLKVKLPTSRRAAR